MGIRATVRAFVRNEARPRHAGHELAHDVRDAMGPLCGGSDGHLTGSSVYHHFEARPNREH